MTMIQLDRTELDKAIEGLEGMYSNTAKVLANYEADKVALELRGNDLNKRLEQLQDKQTKTLLEREAETNTTKYVNLSKQLKEIEEESQIIVSLKEQLQSDFYQLKTKYAPIIRNSYSNDSAVKRDFDVNETVEHVRYELVKAVSDYAVAVREQDSKVIGVIQDEFLSDSMLMQEQRSFRRTFHYDRLKLGYSSALPNLLTRNQINLACGGNIDPEIRKPKGDN